MEWHDFECAKTLNWSQVSTRRVSRFASISRVVVRFTSIPAITTIVNPSTGGFHYAADEKRLRADRHAGQRHRFLTVEMSRNWLREAVRGHETVLNRESPKAFSKPSQGFELRGSNHLTPVSDVVPRKCSTTHRGSGGRLLVPCHDSELVL